MRSSRYFLFAALVFAIMSGCTAHQAAYSGPGVASPASLAKPYIVQNGQSPGPWAFFACCGPATNGQMRIVVGPSNTLYAENPQDSYVQSVTMNGIVQGYNMETNQDVYPDIWGMANGPDGRIWFSDRAGFLDAMTPAGAITNYPVATNQPFEIALGPDGNLWATAWPSGIVKSTPTGSMTAYSLSGQYFPADIIAGPDGNLWFAESANNSIGRITTSGVILESAIIPAFEPYDIAAGSDGNIYFSGHGTTPVIGAMTTGGAMINEWTVPFPSPPGTVYGLAPGPRADVWFSGADQAGGYLGKFTRPNHWTLYATPGSFNVPNGLVVGPDSNMWFGNGGTISRDSSGGWFGVYEFNVLTVSPQHIYFDPPKPPTRVITVRETPHGGTWTAVSSNTGVATVAPGPERNQFTVAAVARGGATITVQDAFLNYFVVNVNVINP
jgi:virginiamycin B lyase